ncbi:MAG: cation transporter [Gemmatimonadales bacterium]
MTHTRIPIHTGSENAAAVRRVYLRAWLLTLVIVGLEIAGSLASGSLALLADIGHVVADTILALIPLALAHGAHRGMRSRFATEAGGLTAAVLLAFIGYHIVRDAQLDLQYGGEHDVRGWLLFLFSGPAAVVNFAQHRLLSGVTRLQRDAAHRGLHFHVLADLVKNVVLPVLGVGIALHRVSPRADLLVALVIGVVVMVRAVALGAEIAIARGGAGHGSSDGST